MDGDALEADADVVPEVAVVAVGEDAPRQDPDDDVACGKAMQVQRCVAVVRVLEHDEEVLWLVANHLDVSLADAQPRTEGPLDLIWPDVVVVPAQTRHHGVCGEVRQSIIHGAVGSRHG